MATRSADTRAPAVVEQVGSAQSSVAAQRAEHLLSHYLRRVWVEAGLKWDSDNDAEVGEIVDALVDATREVVEQHVRTATHSCYCGPLA